jgi:hypothetical protein
VFVKVLSMHINVQVVPENVNFTHFMISQFTGIEIIQVSKK